MQSWVYVTTLDGLSFEGALSRLFEYAELRRTTRALKGKCLLAMGEDLSKFTLIHVAILHKLMNGLFAPHYSAI